MYDHITTPWLLLGDFNQVVRQEDNRGARAVWDYGAKRMLCMIDKCKLIDVEFSGPRFTWTNGQLGHLLIEQQRLDQGWANEAWHDRFHSSALHHLPRTNSDHHSLLLDLNASRKHLSLPNHSNFRSVRWGT